MDISFNPNLPTSDNERDALQNSQSLDRRLEARSAKIGCLLATLPQIVWLAEVDGSVTNFNPRWYEYTGLTAEESLGWEFLKAIHPEECEILRDSFAASVIACYQAASNKPSSDPIECRIRGADRTYRWFIRQRTPVRGANGQILKWVGTYTLQEEPLHPVDDRVSGKGRRESSFSLFPFPFSQSNEDSPLCFKEKESSERPVELTPVLATGNQPPAKLRLREQPEGNTAQSVQQRRRNLINELSHAIIWEADATTEQFTFVSESAERLLGYPIEQWLDEPDFWVNLIHPEDRPWTLAVCRKRMFQCRDYELEYRCLAADQRVVWLRDRAFVIRDEQGQAHKRRGLMVDITIAKQAEAELHVRLRQQSAIAQLGQQALLGIPVSTLMDECLSLVCQTLEVEYCQVWELLPDGNTLKLRAGVGWRDGLVGHTQIDASANTQVGYTLQLRQPVVVEDLHSETLWQRAPWLHDHNIISGISAIIGAASSTGKGGGERERGRAGEREKASTFLTGLSIHLHRLTKAPVTPSPPHPLTPSPQPFGVLAAHTSRRRVFSDSDVDFLQSVANVLAGAMQCHQVAQDLIEAKDLLAHTTATLEKRNRELDEFAYITSHDLKAPLRAIANLSQWIEEDIADQLNQENLHQMQLLRGRVLRLEALINGLLQYSRAGRLKAEPELVDVAALLKQVIDTLKPPAQFTITIAPGMPKFITQRLPLQQVFTHLIDNAIRHHPLADGTVIIGGGEQLDTYEFAISDDGVGIAPQFHERVFAIFQTLQAKDSVENTGMGLAIAKRIVEGKGGTIRLQSQEGQGATFYFTWPKVLH